MREIYRRFVRTYYSQVGLDSHKDPDAYPKDWTDEDLAITGPKGVAVAVAEDSTVEVVVYVGDGSLGGDRLLSTEILVGDQGFVVGTVPDLDAFPWSPGPGRVSLDVYTEGPVREPTRVMFVLRPLDTQP